VLRLKSCGLGEGGGRVLAETLRLNTTLTSLCLRKNEGGGRALSEAIEHHPHVSRPSREWPGRGRRAGAG